MTNLKIAVKKSLFMEDNAIIGMKSTIAVLDLFLS